MTITLLENEAMCDMHACSYMFSIKTSTAAVKEEEEEEEEEEMEEDLSPIKVAVFDSYEEYKMIMNEVHYMHIHVCVLVDNVLLIMCLCG